MKNIGLSGDMGIVALMMRKSSHYDRAFISVQAKNPGLVACSAITMTPFLDVLRFRR
jgi:hypothetical protein